MAALPETSPETIGLDPEQLQVAYDLLEKWTSGPDAPVPGGAILVGRKGKTVSPRFFGRQSQERGAPAIRQDGLFLLASITKPMTYLAGMILIERGLLSLSDPVTRYIPDFAAHHKEDVRVHHLYTHTSGLPDMLENNAELRAAHAPLSEFVKGAIRDTKLLFPPGTGFSYQSMGTLIVAELVRIISGQRIHDFLKSEIFDPLQLNSIALGSKGLEKSRLVGVQTPDYQKGSDFGWNSDYWREFGAPWGGMFSSPADLAVLCQLMLHGGEVGGTRIVSPATVQAMTENRLNDYADLPEPIRRTAPWGLGWALNHVGQDDTWSDLLSRRVYGHTGSTGTMVWIDPDREGFCILLTTAIRSRAPWRLVRLSNIISAAFVA